MPLKAKIRWPNETEGADGFIKYRIERNGLGRVFIDRASKMNAINHDMNASMLVVLNQWKTDDSVKAVLIEGTGDKAFSAGGDIALGATHVSSNEQRLFDKLVHALSEYFVLHQLIAVYPKPVISLIDGLTMGAGVGLSAHGAFRVATERTKFGMPETRIGFFTDAGASFFLPKLPKKLGYYLALTSDTLDGFDTVLTGVATHYLDSMRISQLHSKLETIDLHTKEPYSVVKSALDSVCSYKPPAGYSFRFSGNRAKVIEECFGKNRVEDIFSCLERNTTDPEFAQVALQTLKERSPTSIKITFELLRRADTEKWSFRKAFDMDASMTKVVLTEHDFVEGVDALLVSKPKRTPQWRPSTVDAVNDDYIKSLFNRTQTDPVHVAYKVDADFNQYPWNFNDLTRL